MVVWKDAQNAALFKEIAMARDEDLLYYKETTKNE
jgi:hypothetical protein